MSRSSFFALAFANYVEMQDDFKQSFADWLKVRRTLRYVNTDDLTVLLLSGKDGDLEVSKAPAYDRPEISSSHPVRSHS